MFSFINTVILVQKSNLMCLLVPHHGLAYTVYHVLVTCDWLSFLNRPQSYVFIHGFSSAWNPCLIPPLLLLRPHLLSSVLPPSLHGLFHHLSGFTAAIIAVQYMP